MNRWKKELSLVLALLCAVCGYVAGCAEEGEAADASAGSWSQINQPVERGAGWQRIVTDRAAFSLGESAPYAEDPSVAVGNLEYFRFHLSLSL